jgi:hypothetical protein
VAKPKKTSRELAEMIVAQMSVRSVRLNVHNGAAGWHGIVYGSSPDRVAQAQAEVDQIVQRLRANYDLDE